MGRYNRLAWIIGGTVLAILLVAVPIISALMLRSGYGSQSPGIMGPWMMFGYGGWLMGIFMFLFWGLIIWGIIALVRYFGRTGQSGLSGDSALEILKRRYARGEITREEFEEKKKTLI